MRKISKEFICHLLFYAIIFVIYKWNGEGGLGANANFMFQGGKLQNKS